MKTEWVDCNTNVDHIGKLSIYGFFFCFIIAVCRLLSHSMKDMPTALDLRIVYFLQCSVLLPWAWKYKATKPALTLLAIMFVFNPITPLRLGSWMTWQVLNFIGLLCMALCAFAIYGTREKMKAISDRLQIEQMNSPAGARR